MEYTELQDEINLLIDSDKLIKAYTLLGQLWRQNPGPAIANYIVSSFEKLIPNLSFISFRVAILRSFTIEPIIPLFRAAAAVNGINLIIHIGDFNTYAQDIINPKSNLYRFSPDMVILDVQTRDITSELWENFANLTSSEIAATVECISNTFQDLIKTFRSNSQAHLVLHTLEMPFLPCCGILDAQLETSQISAIQEINKKISMLIREYTGIYLLDSENLIARYGRFKWHDETKWLTMRMPISADCLVHLANEWLRFVHPLTGKICKVLVMDLDNTLWGGIIGEDGLHGIHLGEGYPGEFFLALQRAILDLYKRGIVLAICSKNNLEDAMEVLEKHPAMLLRPKHFAALRINWTDKTQNLKAIASELNIGLDTLAFIDDNPFECQLVRNQLQEVIVIDLPKDPAGYAQALRDSPFFERLSLSDEDQERGRYYTEQCRRNELFRKTPSLEDFYWSLQMEVEISLASFATLKRIAQLIQKTNQFNLTTHRYNEQQITEMFSSPTYRIYSVKTRDKFGDNGLVGVIIIRREGEKSEIDTFLLSCRVIGRTIETAMLSVIDEQSRKEGVKSLSGWFSPTKKNTLVREFYSSNQFICILNKDEKSLWEYDLNKGKIASPPWIKLINTL